MIAVEELIPRMATEPVIPLQRRLEALIDTSLLANDGTRGSPITRKAVLIEDNANNRYLLAVLLKHAGFTVVELPDGREAVQTVRRESPDVLLLDIQMPDMDGYEVASALKLDPVAASVPIVGVSSFALPGDRYRALKAGFASYLEKPVGPERFAASVLSIFEPGEGAE